MAINIKKLSTTGGFLQKAPIEFSSGLNCIIGARGTCKSTIVETIRFLFNTDKDKVDDMINPKPPEEVGGVSHHGLIAATLGSATARCEVTETGSETQSLVVERDVGSDPRIYKDGVKQLTNQEVLQCVEIYSQGELQRIAEKPELRLQLIDRPNQKTISELSNKRRALAAKLKDVGTGIRARRTGIESRRAELKALETFQQTLAELQTSRPNLPPELDAERAQFNQRQSTLNSAFQLQTKWDGLTNNLLPLADAAEEYRAVAALLKQLEVPEATALSAIYDTIANFAAETKSEADRIAAALPGRFKEALEKFEKLNERYIELRRSQETLNDSLRKEDHIRQQINHLERIREEGAKMLAELNGLQQRRASLRAEIAKVTDEIYSLRAAQVDEINKNHHRKVLLTLTQSSQAEGYRQTLARLLEKSRLRNQDEIAEQIAGRIPPSELVDIVESADSQRLAQVLDRDLGQMTRLVGYLVDNAGLYDVETEIFDDLLDITLFDEGTPKRVDQLSKGQKATAMLPLILREADYPLIFDQPEDDLDNRFIFVTLVERILELKAKRQLIFVTHNANIPVLGDAEKVVVMKMANPEQSGAPDVGNVDGVKDKILSLLEGGAEAFRLRQSKYGTLLTKADAN
ncbi:MAG TPA: AAA family ATPase [Alphaproteobacteria bacterium]|nr:AAA family ATPase [Alphaproteobacteria bacterium]